VKQLIDTLMPFIASGLSVSLLVLALWSWRQKMREKAKALEASASQEPTVGTAEDLKAAEALLHKSEQELRADLLRTHTLIDRFSTLHGFNDQNMNLLRQRLESENIGCEILFQETMPSGVMSIGQRHGFYEVFVRHEDVEAARGIVAEYLK